MRILSRYFLASYVTLFLVILGVSISAITVIELLLNLGDMLGPDSGQPGILRYLALRIPAYYMRDAIPIASFAAAFFCLGLPARWREITAIKAGGISPQRASVPVLAAAAVLSVLALFFNETVALEASRSWDRLGSAGAEFSFRRGSFWYHRGGVVYNIREADDAARVLRGVSVFELGPEGRLERSVRAEEVHIEDADRWRFLDATLRSFDHRDPAARPVTLHVAETVLTFSDQRSLSALSASAENLSLRDLFEYIAARDREGRSALRYHTLLHARLAEPVTVALFALLAIPIGLSVEGTKSLVGSALRGAALVALFYAARSVAALFAASDIGLAAPAPWLLLTLFGGYGVWRFARAPR